MQGGDAHAIVCRSGTEGQRRDVNEKRGGGEDVCDRKKEGGEVTSGEGNRQRIDKQAEANSSLHFSLPFSLSLSFYPFTHSSVRTFLRSA